MIWVKDQHAQAQQWLMHAQAWAQAQSWIMNAQPQAQAQSASEEVAASLRLRLQAQAQAEAPPPCFQRLRVHGQC